MSNQQQKTYSNDIIKVEDEYEKHGDNQNYKRQSVDFFQQNYKNQMSAIEEEDRLFQNSNTEAMTISQIDNFLMQSTTQGEIANLTNINLAEQINNITDADLRKQLMRYDTEDAQANQNANDLSYSNISQIHQSLSNFVDTKEDYPAQGNILSAIKGNSNKEDGIQFQFEKSSKYFQKFLNGDNLNDSSMVQSSSMLYDYPHQRNQSKDMRNLLQDLQPNQDTNTLRAQLNESTQRYKQTLIQNKILIEGYEKLKQQVDDLTKQVNSQQEKKPTSQSKMERDQDNEEDSSKKQKMEKNSHNRSNSFCCKHEEMQKQLHEEIVQKQVAEIENLRQKNLELMSQKADLENNNKSQNFRILELQSQLNAKDAIIKEKNQEIKKLYLSNETFKMDLKHIESLNGLLSPPVRKTIEKTTPSNNNVARKSQRKGSFYSEANNQTLKEKIDQSQVEYQKELSVKSVNLPRRGTNKIPTESSQLLKEEKFNKSVNQYYSTNSNQKTNNPHYGSQQKISIEKINSEIKQLKNSLMSTDRLLRTQRTKNQVLSEKVSQAGQIKTNLEVLPKSNGGNINLQNQSQQQNTSNQYSSQQNQENSQQDQDVNLSLSQKIYQNSEKMQNNTNAQFRNLLSKQLNQKDPLKENQTFNDRNQLQLNETSQSEIQASNFTPRDLSQNMPTPIRYPIPAFQDKSYLNDDQHINQQFINHEQNFTLQNQTPYESNNEGQQVQTPSNVNSSTNQYIAQQQQQQSSSMIQQYQQQQLQQIPHQYSIHQVSQNSQQMGMPQQHQQSIQQSSSKLKNLLNEQFNDNFSQNSRQGATQNSQYNQRPTLDMYYNHQLSNNGSHNQFLSPDQSSQKQFNNLLNKRAMSNQQLYPPNGQQQNQQRSQQNLIQIQQTPQNSYIERQPSQNLSEIPAQEKINNNILDSSYRGVQQQMINTSPYQQQFMQPRNSQSQFSNQINHLQSPQSISSPIQTPYNQQQNQQQQNNIMNTYHSTLMTQGHPPSIYYPPPVPVNQQNSQSQFYQPTNNTLQLSSNLSQNQFQFSNYLNTYPNNLNRSSLNTISSLKGENLKKLNQQLTELELEKNLIETKILKEESKKYGKSVNRNQAIQDLNNKLQQVCVQIEEIRYIMMEQAM